MNVLMNEYWWMFYAINYSHRGSTVGSDNLCSYRVRISPGTYAILAVEAGKSEEPVAVQGFV